MKRQPQDLDSVNAAVDAAMTTLEPIVASGAFEGASKQPVWTEFVRRAEAERPQLEIWLDEAVRQQISIGENLPRLLQLYLASCRIKSKGGRPVNFLVRDSAIYRVVTAITKCGFNFERNIDSLNTTESACSIITTALSKLGVTLPEKNVARIWRDIDKKRSQVSS
jgi:hypothetical protein